MFHSAKWDHNYDFNDKNIAVIGTGASAIQIVPWLQKRVKKLTVFQRSAPYVMPKPDGKVPKWKHLMYYYLPFALKLKRYKLFLERLCLAYPLFFKKNVWYRNAATKLFYKHRNAQVFEFVIL